VGFCFIEADRATDAVLAKVALLILPEKNDAVRAYEADIALLILPEKKDAVDANEAVMALDALTAQLEVPNKLPVNDPVNEDPVMLEEETLVMNNLFVDGLKLITDVSE
jgi:hypothetical protein